MWEHPTPAKVDTTVLKWLYVNTVERYDYNMVNDGLYDIDAFMAEIRPLISIKGRTEMQGDVLPPFRGSDIYGACTCAACPVQYEGELGTWKWYFRARYDKWEFSADRTDPLNQPEFAIADQWTRSDPGISETWQKKYSAGWMPHDTAGWIMLCCLAFLREWE